MSATIDRMREGLKAAIKAKQVESEQLLSEADGLQQALSMLQMIEADEFRKERVS